MQPTLAVPTLLAAACAVGDPPPAECISASLSEELADVPVDVADCSAPASEAGKADRLRGIDTPGLRFLRGRSERELSAIFAAGTADRIPIGANDGTPLLLGLDWLAPKLSAIYVGSIWEALDGERANGDPVVRLRDAWLRTRDGHLVTKFTADVFRDRLANVAVAGRAGPRTASRAHPFVPIFRERLAIDGKPSIFVNYHDDPTPVINRILDEIREVDGRPGLFLGRAHYRRPGGEWVYLYWFALDFSELGEQP